MLPRRALAGCSSWAARWLQQSVGAVSGGWGSLLAPPGQGSASSRAPRPGHVSGWGTGVAKGSRSPGKCKWQSAALAVPSTESAAGLGEDGSSSPLPSRSLHLQPSSPVIARRPLWVTIHKPGRIHGGSDLSPGITPHAPGAAAPSCAPQRHGELEGSPAGGAGAPRSSLSCCPRAPRVARHSSAARAAPRGESPPQGTASGLITAVAGLRNTEAAARWILITRGIVKRAFLFHLQGKDKPVPLKTVQAERGKHIDKLLFQLGMKVPCSSAAHRADAEDRASSPCPQLPKATKLHAPPCHQLCRPPGEPQSPQTASSPVWQP